MSKPIDKEYLLTQLKNFFKIKLNNVDNTSDIDKPISAAQREEFDKINNNLSDLSNAVAEKIESEVATDFSQADTPEFQQTIDDIAGSVSELKGDLVDLSEEITDKNDLYEIIFSVTSEGKYINENGEIITGINSHYSDLIPVELYDKVTFSFTYSDINTVIRMHGYDSDGNWVRQITYLETNKSNTISFKIPSDVVFIRISISTLATNLSLRLITTLNTKLDSVIEEYDTKLKGHYKPETVLGYISSDGKFLEASSYCRTDFIPVYDGLEVYYQGSTPHSGTTAIYGYDEYKNPIGEIQASSSGVNNYSIKIDKTYSYIAMSSTVDNHIFIVRNIVGICNSAIAKPKIGSIVKVGNDNISRAKATCYRNNNHFVLTYGENLDGNTNDFPTQSGSGTLALRYKKFDFVDGVESNVSYGTIAQKETNYIDIDGNTQSMPGGCGLPMGTNDGEMQYFSTAKSDGVFVPMCCSVTVNRDGTVSFGDIHQLSLTIDGVKGDFDFHRNNMFVATYYTTATPYWNGSEWHWCQVVKNGFAYLTSSNGYDWTLQKIFSTDYQPKSEISCVKTSSALFASLRVKGSGNIDTQSILVYIANNDLTGDGLTSVRYYSFPSLSTRSLLQAIDNRHLLYLFNNEEKNKMSIYVICDNLGGNSENDGIHWFKWCDIYNRTVWYASFCDTDIKSVMPNKIHLVGNNSKNETTAMYFAELELDLTLPNITNVTNEFLIV